MYNKFIWLVEKVFPIIMMMCIIGVFIMLMIDAGDRWVFLFALPLMITVTPWSINEFVKLHRLHKEDLEELYGPRESNRTR